MRLLVTGAAGFIGSHLTRTLIASGHDVIVVDNFSRYYSLRLKELRVDELLKPIGVNPINANLDDLEEVREIFDRHEFDAVIHLAAQPGVRVPATGYDKYIRDNLVAFNNVFQMCLTNQVKSFLYASSSSVYGNRPTELLSEKDTELIPVSYYGGTKLANELLANVGVLNSETSAVGMRFFTVYGPYGRPDMAYFRLLANFMDGYDFKMFGDGSVLRDFTFVSDTVTAIEALLNKSLSMKKGTHEIFNIGGGKPASLNQMISIISSNFSSSPKIEMRAAHPGDVRSTNADTQKLELAIGFKPEVSLEDGIQKVIEWANRPSVLPHLKVWAESVN
jgi:UDP-glucuronate 4-epimerase